MKLIVLLCVVALISVDCRPAVAPPSHRRPLLSQPLLLHLGEEFSLQLAGGSSSSSVNQALLELTQRPLQAGGKEKRLEEPPISLDLTFHLLREVLQMARAEQIAQQADSNRRMMDALGR
ncbi:corticoliberin-like [Platichthys flesus]|uniref:corticoliberin-like n=1 Tax=Platichthys flesus TaxID=8260 RepID=UPI002DBF1AF9|nr:corticoliberin-like [Platichthys flesus]